MNRKLLKILGMSKASIMTLNTKSWELDKRRGLQSLHKVQKFSLQIMEATKALKSQTRKKIPDERFLLIWHPKGPTYDQKKTQGIRPLPTCFFCSYLNIYGRNLRNRQKKAFLIH